MDRYNFIYYNKDAEKDGGDYWKFVESSVIDLEKADIYLDDLSKIMREIRNEELFQKMKQKLFNLIMENGVDTRLASGSLDIFSSQELKQILEHEVNKKIEKCKIEPDRMKYSLSGIIDLLYLLNKAKDPAWEYSMMIRFVELVKNNPDKSFLVVLIERNRRDKKVYEKLIRDYFEYLPIEYKNYLKMQSDPYYIQKKYLELLDENLDVGIDPRIAIGPEIEANNHYDIHIDFGGQRGFEDYTRTTDATVPNGDEVSPTSPFHNTKEDITKFCAICKAMEDMGYYYDRVSGNASGQINLGLDYLDTKEAILNFYEIYGNCEELLYYISNGEGELFRQSVYSSSRIKPISEIIGKRVVDEVSTREDIIKLFNNHLYETKGVISGLQYKKNSVCLRGTNSEDYRLEFRIPNGGCNYQTWIDNIRLYGKMLEVSKTLADAMKKDYLTSKEERLLNLKIDLQDISLSFEEKLKILMDLLFEDNNIKQIYYDRYIQTVRKIEETNDERYQDVYGSCEPGFDELEFIEQYKSRLDPDYNGRGVVEYDPATDTMTYGRKK